MVRKIEEQAKLEDQETRVTLYCLDAAMLRDYKGAPGMPEAGYMPIPRKLAAQGVKDMVRMSDARMSGTASGTIVLHITPESAEGGPLGLVRTGDVIEFVNEEIERLQVEIARKLGYKLVDHRLELYGVPLDDSEKS